MLMWKYCKIVFFTIYTIWSCKEKVWQNTFPTMTLWLKSPKKGAQLKWSFSGQWFGTFFVKIWAKLKNFLTLRQKLFWTHQSILWLPGALLWFVNQNVVNKIVKGVFSKIYFGFDTCSYGSKWNFLVQFNWGFLKRSILGTSKQDCI